MSEILFAEADTFFRTIHPLVKLSFCITVLPMVLLAVARFTAIKRADTMPIMGTYRKRTVR